MEELCSALNCCTLDHLVAQMVENNPETTNIIDDIIEYSGAIEWGKLIGDINSQEDLIQLLDSIQAGLENKIEATTNAIFRYKGNVETVDSLPSENNEQGDVYNVNETGANYCWNGQTWDKLSETHDLSVFLTIESFKNQIVNYYTKAEVDAIIENINKVIANINQKISEMTELAAADKAELKSIIDTKADASKVETDLNDVKTSLESTKTEIKSDLETKADKAKFEALEAVAVPYKEFTYNDQVRKTIQLDNYDSISGIATDGSGHNLAMLSKWDVADFGATGIHCNLNTKDTVTINDNLVVATTKDIEEAIASVDHSTYASKEEVSAIDAKVQEVKSELELKADKTELEPLATKEYVDSAVAGVDHSTYATKEEVAVKADKTELEVLATKEELEQAISGVDHSMFATKEELAANKSELEAEIANKADAENNVAYKDFTYEGVERKTIQLANYDSISGVGTNGNGYHLAMVSKYDVADFGDKDIHCNLNTSQIVTVNDTQAVITDALMERIVLAGNNIAIDKKELTDEATGFKFNAYEVSSDLSTLATKDEVKGGLADANASVAAVISRLDILEDKVSNLKKTNIEAQAITSDAGELNVSNPDIDYVVSGEVAAKTTIEGKSVTLKDSSINSAVITLKASEDVDIKATNIEGTFDKATMGNAVGIVKSDGYVSIKDCTITPDKAYNGIEILGTPKNVLIDNVKFEGKFDNNAISIYATADDAIVTISNCHFNDVSNILRISNQNGGKATYNIINCVCDNWEANAEFSGAVICQDYTSKSAEAEIENALFKNVTINIQNLTIPGNVKLEKPEDVSTILGSGEGQILYVYGDQNGLFAYNPDIYPTVNIQ